MNNGDDMVIIPRKFFENKKLEGLGFYSTVFKIKVDLHWNMELQLLNVEAQIALHLKL